MIVCLSASANGAQDPGVSAGLLQKLAEENPMALILGGAAAGIILMTIFLTIFICVRRRARKGKVTEKDRKQETAGNGIRVGKLHEQGARTGQQDCFGVSDESLMESRGLLAVVADGMGGLEDGDRVSEAAVGAILDGFALYQGRGTPEQQLTMLAKQALDSVNELLGAANFRKSGSTLVMALVRDGACSFLSVGDSRICLYRDGNLMLLNREHIFKNKLLLDAINGELPLQEAYTDSRGSGLTSFLGMGILEHIDIPSEPIKLIPGDKLLLMSDGVYNALTEEELKATLDAEPEEAAERLHQAIQEKAYTNQDNYTAVILEWGFHTENPD